MKQHPLVTIIIATYNRAETLQYAINSVLWQTYSNFELLVVGDACTDHTDQIMKNYTDDPRVFWYNLPENSGYQSVPNNFGIQKGKGKYIAYLNHDDLWLPNHIEALVHHLENTEGDFAFSILYWAYCSRPSRLEIPVLPEMPIPPEATAILHRRDVVDRIGGWKDIHETFAYPRVEFFRRAQFAGLSFDSVPVVSAVKFLWAEENYNDVGPQPEYMELIKNQPNFFQKDVLKKLMELQREQNTSISSFLLRPSKWGDMLRLLAIRNRIHPAQLKFWKGKGQRIKKWRRLHRLT
ncbi:MAG: glycosyltransferase family A protein [Bacteroidota bacterium]